ncbi:MAG: hypothetical protein GTO63_03875 [Anaerolineae bacterium]|nr:hypothetical protein [Anaerolineae bacterium]NIN94151.1 hypothetical protein [Anaerolineae bacterium]NIQ77193.1 hypothetical protein [Anaerolineae bacterium]
MDRGADDIRYAARISGLQLGGIFLFVLVLALTNEDGVPAQALPKLFLLVVAILGVGMAWRWERVGGMMLIVSALALSLSVYQAYPILGPVGLLLAVLIYTPLPLIAGILFLLSSRGTRRGIVSGRAFGCTKSGSSLCATLKDEPG